jgi:hypothetical protein
VSTECPVWGNYLDGFVTVTIGSLHPPSTLSVPLLLSLPELLVPLLFLSFFLLALALDFSEHPSPYHLCFLAPRYHPLLLFHSEALSLSSVLQSSTPFLVNIQMFFLSLLPFWLLFSLHTVSSLTPNQRKGRWT